MLSDTNHTPIHESNRKRINKQKKEIMKRKKLLIALLVVLAGLSGRHAVAQPEIRYPNPAYLHWEEPCTDNFGYFWNSGVGEVWFPGTGADFTDFIWPSNMGEEVYTKNGCAVNPFGTADSMQTLYGVAIPVIPITTGVPPLPPMMDRRITFDILLYSFTPGDSLVQLVKSQTFAVEEDQSPDLYMVFKEYDYASGNPSPFHDTLVKFPMREFYFDSPQKMYGNFFVGIHSTDTFVTAMGVLCNNSCCHSGYAGFIDMDKKMFLAYVSCGSSSICCSSEGIYDGLDWHPHGVAVPMTETVYGSSSQFVYPILRPQGYLNATTPEKEAGNVRLLPNPARTRVTVEADCAIRNVEVMDMLGSVILLERYDGDVRSATLDVSNLAQGSYVVKVKTEQNVSVQKLIVGN